MRYHPYRRSAVLACAALASSAGVASAQIDPFPNRNFTLSESDVAVIEEVAGGLISGKVVPTGTKLDWYNGETRRRGTIEVVGSSQFDGNPCHQLRYTFPLTSRPGKRGVRPELVQDAGRRVEDRIQVTLAASPPGRSDGRFPTHPRERRPNGHCDRRPCGVARVMWEPAETWRRAGRARFGDRRGPRAAGSGRHADQALDRHGQALDGHGQARLLAPRRS